MQVPILVGIIAVCLLYLNGEADSAILAAYGVLAVAATKLILVVAGRLYTEILMMVTPPPMPGTPTGGGNVAEAVVGGAGIEHDDSDDDDDDDEPYMTKEEERIISSKAASGGFGGGRVSERVLHAIGLSRWDGSAKRVIAYMLSEKLIEPHEQAYKMTDAGKIRFGWIERTSPTPPINSSKSLH